MPNPKRLRIDPGIDAQLKAWIIDHTHPGDAFLSIGHAMEIALARVLDELHYIQTRCEKEGLAFQSDAYWALHQDLLQASTPNPKAAPRRKGNPTHRDLQRVFVSVSQDLVRSVRDLVPPKGPFSPANPVAHAAEYGLLLLYQSQAGTVRPTQFPFDEQGLWQRYLNEVR